MVDWSHSSTGAAALALDSAAVAPGGAASDAQVSAGVAPGSAALAPVSAAPAPGSAADAQGSAALAPESETGIVREKFREILRKRLLVVDEHPTLTRMFQFSVPHRRLPPHVAVADWP